jgi:hypothetical protein
MRYPATLQQRYDSSRRARYRQQKQTPGHHVMRKFVVGVALALLACRGETRTESNQKTSDTVRSDTLRATVPPGVQQTGNPSLNALEIIDTVPSSSATTYDDSVLAISIGDHPVVTDRGDTMRYLGGTMFMVDTTKDYGAEEYEKNGVHYLRVVLQTGHLPNGRPINITKARVRLPALRPGEELILASLCRVDGKEDPRILAIATVPEGSDFGPARLAWRFDPVTQTLSGISTHNVTCAHIVGED